MSKPIAQASSGQGKVHSVDLKGHQTDTLNLMLSGHFSPLTSYLGCADAESVLTRGRLANDVAMPVPMLLAIPEQLQAVAAVGDTLQLRDVEGVLLASLLVTEIWSTELISPAARAVIQQCEGEVASAYVAGVVTAVEAIVHYDFVPLRLNTSETRGQFSKLGWRNVVACQPPEILHRADTARIAHAARVAEANILVQALATSDEAITLDHYTRIRCLEQGLKYLPDRGAMLTLASRPAFPNGGVGIAMRALIARNAGATHLLVEPEWWTDSDTVTREETQGLARELAIELVDLPRFVRDDALGAFLPVSDKNGGATASDTTKDIVQRVRGAVDIPQWLSFPEVITELRSSHPVRGRQGVTVFLTGLSGAGKSTIARVLLAKLLEIGERTVTLLDGDVVRKNLSSELGFSRAHRDLNIKRIGFVASEITKHGGIALCAPIAPYRDTRNAVRAMIQQHGGFFEVHVATPLETCEARDRKGLYAKARAGIIKEFTGISDPYEAPEAPELVIDTREMSPLEAAQMIVTRLENERFIG